MRGSLLVAAILAILATGASAQVWQETSIEGFTLRWATMTGNNLAVELSAPTTGWVSVGFDPTMMMLDANIIIGYVASGNQVLRDDYGWQTTSHRDDTILGGTTDVTSDGGTESGGITTLMFTIPMDSGDIYDRVLVGGNSYTVILGRSANGEDNFTAPHSVRTTTTIDILVNALDQSSWGQIKTAIL